MRLETRAPLRIFFGMAIFYGLTYSLVHEKKLLPFISFFVVFAASFAAAGWLSRQRWFSDAINRKGRNLIIIPPNRNK
jgi:hypothetical protein